MAAPAIGIRPRWAPRQSVVDPTHPLSQGLWFHRLSSQPGRNAANVSWGMSPYGPCVQSSDTASTRAVEIPKMPGDGSYADFTLHTVKAMSSMAGYATSAGVPTDPQSASWSAPYWVMTFAADAGNTTAFIHTNNAGSGVNIGFSTSGFYLTDSLFHSYTASWGTQGAIIYRDGAQFETSATTPNGSSLMTPSAIIGTPETVFCSRSVSAPGEGFVGQHVLQIAWLRRLSAAEVAMVHADPFCFMVR